MGEESCIVGGSDMGKLVQYVTTTIAANPDNKFGTFPDNKLSA